MLGLLSHRFSQFHILEHLIFLLVKLLQVAMHTLLVIVPQEVSQRNILLHLFALSTDYFRS